MLIPSRAKILESSFINAMFRSRWTFSITLAASAVMMFGALWMPAVIAAPYTAAARFSAFVLWPLTTFTMPVTVCCLSPGLTRSGE